MHLRIKNAAPTTIDAAKRQSTLNLLYHRAKSRIFCALFTVDGMVATQSDRAWGPATQRRCATSGSLVAESGWLVGWLVIEVEYLYSAYSKV